MRARDLFRIAVQDFMIQQDIKQKVLAKAVGETQSNICEFLKGERPLHHKKERIAKFFKKDYIDLLKYGQKLIGENPDLLQFTNSKTIEVEGKKIRVSTLYSKVRFIFSYDSLERSFLIADIEKYYSSLSKKIKDQVPTGKNKTA